MPMIEGVRFCDGCGAEVVGAPIVRGQLLYCCQDCSEGQECDCALVFEEERREVGAQGEVF
jgi:hypothetical protein